jgi:hypothetical protein
MGFFSWKTCDTGESIFNTSSDRETISVAMVDDKGSVYIEDEYEGYGVFGGKDYYQLVAKMNVPDKCNGDVDHDRILGIEIVFKDNKGGDIAWEDKLKIKVPILVTANILNYTRDYKKLWEITRPPVTCEYQGYFI